MRKPYPKKRYKNLFYLERERFKLPMDKECCWRVRKSKEISCITLNKCFNQASVDFNTVWFFFS